MMRSIFFACIFLSLSACHGPSDTHVIPPVQAASAPDTIAPYKEVWVMPQLYAGAKYEDFYLYYGLVGLGSGFGQRAATLHVYRNICIYTREQNSFYANRERMPADIVYVGPFNEASVDSILTITASMKDTSVYQCNPDIMSGDILGLSIEKGGKSHSFELVNCSDKTATKIIGVINRNLPDTLKLPTLSDMDDFRNCTKK